MLREDETWHRLREWTRGQPSSERLAAQLLIDLGYEDIDPSHPLGGKDGGKDAICTKSGQRWIMAAYFPRGQKTFAEIRDKFQDDAGKVSAANAVGIAFVTNQELTLSQRSALDASVSLQTDLIHLERATAILDKPTMAGVRAQFLDIDFSNDDLKKAVAAEIAGSTAMIKAAITGGDTWGYVMLYNFDLKDNVARNYVFIRKGDHPLYQVRTRVHDMDTGRDVRIDEWGEISAPASYQTLRWPLHENVYYRAFHHARNGQWHQDMILRRVEAAQCWLCATRVSDFLGNPGWIHTDPQFAELVGEPNWRP
ncbi:MAG TPA: hypothetical protein VK614_03730 [Allosphingosinicella sp.]|nr:hypothetical protein [Allosphingosinicella sp.]